MVKERVAGLPLEQVLGWAEFCGLRVAVDRGVFVPRRRTEFLARTAITLGWQAARPGEPLVVLDLCCGSGAVGAAVAAALGPVELHAADVDPAAVRCAWRNVAAAGGQVHEGDLFDPLPPGLRGRVGILTANVPYIPTDQIALLPAEARSARAPGSARRRRGRPGPAAAGGRRRAAVAGARRQRTERGQRAAGAGGQRGLRRGRPGNTRDGQRGPERHRGRRHPAPVKPDERLTRAAPRDPAGGSGWRWCTPGPGCLARWPPPSSCLSAGGPCSAPCGCRSQSVVWFSRGGAAR